jgi:hypothetical protein
MEILHFLLTKSQELSMIIMSPEHKNIRRISLMDDYYSDNQPELIHCEYCGEDYAATYRACPFCHTAPNGKKVGSRSNGNRRSGGGSRVRTNTRGGGYGGARSPLSIIGIILSVILIVAAIVIVASLVRSALANRATGDDAIASAVSSQLAEDDDKKDDSTMVVTPDGVTLDFQEANLQAGETLTLTATINPSGWVGQVIWTTSDSAVATVDQSGVVTYVGDGMCTITASAAGVTASCAVTCGAAGDATEPTTSDEPSTPDEPTTSSIVVTAYGNTMDGDFTLKVGDVIPFVANGGSGDYTWSIGDASVASVDANGNCTALSAGKTTMTVTAGGESTTVVIRVKD